MSALVYFHTQCDIIPHILTMGVKMDSLEFEEWRIRLGLKKSEAANRLGMHPNTITKYTNGTLKIPKVVALACDAVSLGRVR